MDEIKKKKHFLAGLLHEIIFAFKRDQVMHARSTRMSPLHIRVVSINIYVMDCFLMLCIFLSQCLKMYINNNYKDHNFRSHDRARVDPKGF